MLANKTTLILRPHYNQGLELVTIRKGSTRWQVENRIYEVQAGDLFFTLPWEEHGGLTTREPGLEIDWIDIPLGKKVNQLRKPRSLNLPQNHWQNITKTLLTSTTRCVPSTPHITTALHRIIHWHNNPTQDSNTRIDLLLPLLLLDVAQAISQGRDHSKPAKDKSTLRVIKLLDQLQQDPAQPVSLTELAESCNLGRSRFADIVKHHTGDSPIQFINRLRIERACHLLETTNKSITQITFETGFESTQYFARTFRAFQHCTPTQFRQS
ncbi:helix-turn-helix transcriptional regulator [Planctomycetota bacterium]|nr:helix-turn-helix transcriptional regulator [Planctomycetota bacterium]